MQNHCSRREAQPVRVAVHGAVGQDHLERAGELRASLAVKHAAAAQRKRHRCHVDWAAVYRQFHTRTHAAEGRACQRCARGLACENAATLAHHRRRIAAEAAVFRHRARVARAECGGHVRLHALVGVGALHLVQRRHVGGARRVRVKPQRQRAERGERHRVRDARQRAERAGHNRRRHVEVGRAAASQHRHDAAVERRAVGIACAERSASVQAEDTSAGR
eukprot:scaffold79984_cov72-Phaeocystis_antarctica.AAC.1